MSKRRTMTIDVGFATVEGKYLVLEATGKRVRIDIESYWMLEYLADKCTTELRKRRDALNASLANIQKEAAR